MSVNQYAMDALTRHQVYIQRFGGGEFKKLLPFMERMLRDINVRLMSEELTAFQWGRLNALQHDLSVVITGTMANMSQKLVDDLTGFAEYEAGFTERLLGSMATVEISGLSLEQVKASVTTSPMTLVSGKSVVNITIPQAITQLAGTTSQTLNHVIQAGIAQGDTTAVIAKEVGRVVKHRTKAQIEALVRTAANHIGTTARTAVYAENAEVMDTERFTATLDSRTSLTCASLDGEVFNVNEGPHPALHFNCRSVRVPIVKPEYAIKGLVGERPSVGSDGVEVLPANTTYGGWLKRQPAAFQDEALGKERGKLFRNGGLSIDKFTDDRNITYTLDQLRALEPHAFELANL